MPRTASWFPRRDADAAIEEMREMGTWHAVIVTFQFENMTVARDPGYAIFLDGVLAFEGERTAFAFRGHGRRFEAVEEGAVVYLDEGRSLRFAPNGAITDGPIRQIQRDLEEWTAVPPDPEAVEILPPAEPPPGEFPISNAYLASGAMGCLAFVMGYTSLTFFAVSRITPGVVTGALTILAAYLCLRLSRRAQSLEIRLRDRSILREREP